MSSYNHTLKPVIYTPDSPLRQPGRLFQSMLNDLWSSRSLAWRLARRDLSAQYRQTVLGYLWALLPPLATAAVWIFLNYSQIVTVADSGVPYPVFVLTGTIFWQLFIDSLNAPIAQINANRPMLAKIHFPKEALILSGMVQVLFSCLIKLVILLLISLAFRVQIHWSALLLFFPVAGLVLIGTVVGMMLVPASFLYKDIQQAIVILINPIMFFTPVLYPNQSASILSTAMRVNPLTPFFNLLRELIFHGTSRYFGPCLIIFVITAIALFSAWIAYRLALPILTERLDA